MVERGGGKQHEGNTRNYGRGDWAVASPCKAVLERGQARERRAMHEWNVLCSFRLQPVPRLLAAATTTSTTTTNANVNATASFANMLCVCP